jgi:hypothetical protein
MDEFEINNLDDFFPIADSIDDEKELATAAEIAQVGIVIEPGNELPQVWKISFDNEDENGVKEDQLAPSLPLRTSSTRIELFDRLASVDGSPLPEEDSDSLVELESSFSFASLSVEESPKSSPVETPIENSQILTPKDFELEYREVVVDKNGQPRQAGSDSAEGEFIRRFKKRAEESLFIFLKGILGRFFLTAHFHQDVCRFLQKTPPYRKLVLMPREHAKTAIVSGGLPSHILIQPKESNIYFPGLEGSECRILLAGETERMAKKNLRVVKNVFEENKVFRAFWPHRCWGIDETRAKEWSSESIIIPRENEWPDPTIKAVGVGGAITGARPNVMIKDDLVSFKAMNSEIVMQEAIDWHVASRALLDTYEVESGLSSLEFIIGTRWAVHDLYSYIIDNDPSVAVINNAYHRIINNGKILWPEKHTKESIEQLRLEHGSMFYLLYLNSAADPSLTDFDIELIRQFKIIDGRIVFAGESRDTWLKERTGKLSDLGEFAVEKGGQSVIAPGTPLSLLRLQESLRGGGGCRIRG